MEHLHAMESARRFRELAQFYGDAAKQVTSQTSKAHYLRLYQVCEEQAYQLEVSVVGAPVVNGGTIKSDIALNR